MIQNYERAFDGYDSGPSTKGNADLRRTREQMTEVHFIQTTMNAKKDMFLSNKKNKQSFIFLLSRSLEQMVAK